jgi:O-antigen/teichoic acid export membrane protein
MGNIRRQTILSSIVIYIGFAIGFINTFFYVKHGTFTTEQYGLTRIFNDLGITFFSFASFGVISVINKFRPFYTQNLQRKENDQAAWTYLIVTVGFILLTIAAILFKPLFIRKFTAKSPLLVDYYYWLLPYALGILYFSVSESFAWFAHKSILTNFLKETGIRLMQTALILCFLFRLITFSTFVKIFACTYPVIAIVLLAYLVYTRKLEFNFKISRVTEKFYKKMTGLMGLIYASLVINTLAQYVDSIIIASVSKGGLSDVGVYTLATFIATTMQVPQRSIIGAVIPALSIAWKNKNYKDINKIYTRTSINLLLPALLIFSIIWLNINDIFTVLGVNAAYEAGKTVILILGISKIIDAGTGVNSQIIGTSNYWRFEVLTGILLLAISIPLNYLLVKSYGINGSAISNLISYAIYNAVRLAFIWKKFKMQPFSVKTIYALIAAIIIYFFCYYLFQSLHGWYAIFIKTASFATIFIASVFLLKLTPDAWQLWEIIKGRLGVGKKN